MNPRIYISTSIQVLFYSFNISFLTASKSGEVGDCVVAHPTNTKAAIVVISMFFMSPKA